MTKRIYFRADKRPIKPGDAISTAGEFIGLHPPSGKLTEALLNDRKPSWKPDRSTALMLFENEGCAKVFCARMAGGFLYSVIIDEAEILHRGDMQIVNKLALQYFRGDTVDLELADAYWRGEIHDMACIEVLVLSGVVVEQLIFTQLEKTEINKRLFGVRGHDDDDASA